MSLTLVYGWHGTAPVADGTWQWVHTPDETYDNPYPREGFDGPPYKGAVHTNVDIIATQTIVTLNGKVIVDTKGHHLICRQCGAES